MHTYTNPFHQPGKPEYGPPVYETDATPHKHRGYVLYERVRGAVVDIVHKGVCVQQYCTLKAARRGVDLLIAQAQFPDGTTVRVRGDVPLWRGKLGYVLHVSAPWGNDVTVCVAIDGQKYSFDPKELEAA